MPWFPDFASAVELARQRDSGCTNAARTGCWPRLVPTTTSNHRSSPTYEWSVQEITMRLPVRVTT
jgi:hypothetical protein